MNSWSRLCWPTLMSSRSSRNFCSYQSSHSRVARSASMPLAVCKVSRIAAPRLSPWIWRALILKVPPYQTEGPLGVDLHGHLRQAVIGGASHVLLRSRCPAPRWSPARAKEMASLAQQCAQPPHVAQHAPLREMPFTNPKGPAEGQALSPGWSCSSVGTWMTGGWRRARRAGAVTAYGPGEQRRRIARQSGPARLATFARTGGVARMPIPCPPPAPPPAGTVTVPPGLHCGEDTNRNCDQVAIHGCDCEYRRFA